MEYARNTAALEKYYNYHNKQSVHVVPELLKDFEGRIPELWRKLKWKYEGIVDEEYEKLKKQDWKGI